MEYRLIGEAYLEEIVALMAKCNNDQEQYIPYCSLKVESIQRDLEELFEEQACCVVGALEGGKLVGVIAWYIDTPKRRAEIIAFFIDSKDRSVWQQIAKQLFQYITPYVQGLEQLFFYVGMENRNVLFFLEEEIKADFKGNEFGMMLTEKTYCGIEEEKDKGTNRLEESIKSHFIALHDGIFPGTYYSGEEIVEKLDSINMTVEAENQQALNLYLRLGF